MPISLITSRRGSCLRPSRKLFLRAGLNRFCPTLLHARAIISRVLFVFDQQNTAYPSTPTLRCSACFLPEAGRTDTAGIGKRDIEGAALPTPSLSRINRPPCSSTRYLVMVSPTPSRHVFENVKHRPAGNGRRCKGEIPHRYLSESEICRSALLLMRFKLT